MIKSQPKIFYARCLQLHKKFIRQCGTVVFVERAAPQKRSPSVGRWEHVLTVLCLVPVICSGTENYGDLQRVSEVRQGPTAKLSGGEGERSEPEGAPLRGHPEGVR